MVQNDGFDECDELESVDAGELRHVLGCNVETGAGVGTGTRDNCVLLHCCRPLVVNGVDTVSCQQDRVGSTLRS